VVDVRDAITQDFVALLGSEPARSVHAVTMLEDGEPLVIGGFYHDGDRLVVFGEVKPGADIAAWGRRRAMVAGYRRIVELLEARGIFAYAGADPVPGAGQLLEHMGFERVLGPYYRRVPGRQAWT